MLFTSQADAFSAYLEAILNPSNMMLVSSPYTFSFLSLLEIMFNIQGILLYWGPGSHPGDVYYSNHIGSHHGSFTGSAEKRSSNNKKQGFVLFLTTFLKNSKQYNNDQEEYKCKKQILILTIQEWAKTIGELTSINRSLL